MIKARENSMQQPTFTVDQKLKALEIVVSMIGPIKLPDDSVKDTDAAFVATKDIVMDYVRFAGLILEATDLIHPAIS